MLTPDSRTPPRRRRGPYEWSDPQILAANRRGEVAPEQLAGIGFISTLIVSLFAAMALGSCIVMCAQANITGSGAAFLRFGCIGVLALALVAVVATMQLRSRRLRYRYRADTIREGLGRVVFGQNAYVAEVDGMRMGPLQRFRSLPPPGEYTFYYLATARKIIAAEQRGQPVAAPAASVYASTPTYAPVPVPDLTLLQDALLRANRFTLQDLDENRMGRVSEEQRRRLRRQGWYGALAGLLFVGLTLIFVLSVLVNIFDLTRAWLDSLARLMMGLLGAPYPIALIVVWAATLALVVAPALLWAWALRIQRAQAPLTVYEGAVGRLSDNESGYFYTLENLNLRVTFRGYAALVPMDYYRVYYVRPGKTLLSIEPLRPSEWRRADQVRFPVS